jgi:TPR repeat protein
MLRLCPFHARFLATLIAALTLATPAVAEDIGTGNATFSEAVQAVKDRDYRHAMKLFAVQADQNQHDAQYNLALLLEAGKGVPQDFSKALVWAWSAKLGGIEAAGDLAEDLIDLLPEKAIENVRQEVKVRLEARVADGSALAVSQFAQYHLDMLEEPDFETAYIWYSIATAIGLPGALEARDDARENVDDEKIAELQAEAGTIFETLVIASN